jgi:hypothetical protein
MKEFKFDNYRLFYVSGPSDYAAKITCYNKDVRVAMIMFTEGSVQLPENDLQSIPLKIYFPLTSFHNILTICQTENPLSIYIYDNGKTCEIGKREKPLSKIN